MRERHSGARFAIENKLETCYGYCGDSNEPLGVNDMGKNQYVVRNGSGWGVRGEGNGKLTKSFQTQNEAIDFARPIARSQRSELRIQSRDGTFRNDPHPPKG